MGLFFTTPTRCVGVGQQLDKVDHALIRNPSATGEEHRPKDYVNKEISPHRVRASDSPDRVPEDDGDYLRIGDGSGTTNAKSCGFCATLVGRDKTYEVFHGGFSHGTNNFAEIMAYALPLFHLADRHNGGKLCRVHVITDSQYVQGGGTELSSEARKANKPLWHWIQRCRMDGLHIQWHHVGKDQLALNRLAHDVSNSARKAMLEPWVQEALQNQGAETVRQLLRTTKKRKPQQEV